jgi:predicted amidohydrolase
MVVDPWGDIIGQSSDKEGYFLCELDLSYLDKVRGQMNCLTHVKHGLLI